MFRSTAEDVSHLWSRAAFGISADGADSRAGRPLDELIAELVDTPAAPMPKPAALSGTLAEFFKAWAVADAWLEWMVATPTPGAEKLAWFWHNHFPVSVAKVQYGTPVWKYVEILRSRGQGPFRALLGATVTSAAMLGYLDNMMNRRGKINENLGRELLELFTVGVGNFTQRDVVEASRSLTGWTVNLATLESVFVPVNFDNGAKTVLGITGNFDANGIFDLLTTEPWRRVTARHVVGRLWTAWAYPNPDAALVDSLATQAIAGGMTGSAFARAVLSHPAFFSPEAKGRPRTPLESVVAGLRASGCTAAQALAPNALRTAGHHPLAPPNVGGWPAPRDLWNFSSWSAVSSVHTNAALAAATRRPSPIPGTAHLPTVDAARTLLRHVGVIAPSEATVEAMASYLDETRRVGPGWEPAMGHLAATLSPEFARS